MKTIYLMLFYMTIQGAFGQTDTTTVYLIRHAEKADSSANPDLSVAGVARAAGWAKYFENINIDLLFSTPYKRTQQTCSPAAFSKHREINTYKPEEMDLAALIKNNPGKTMLIVGHSNTIPKYVNRLIGKEVYADISETEFGDLYVIKATADGNVTYELIKM